MKLLVILFYAVHEYIFLATKMHSVFVFHKKCKTQTSLKQISTVSELNKMFDYFRKQGCFEDLRLKYLASSEIFCF